MFTRSSHECLVPGVRNAVVMSVREVVAHVRLASLCDMLEGSMTSAFLWSKVSMR